MRALLQRVTQATVSVDGQTVGHIGHGWLVLLGVGHGDTPAIASALADKVAGLRCFEDAEGKTNLSILDVGGAVLLVSQFTLFASTKKGNRPSYSRAARPEIAVPLFEAFTRKLSEDLGKPVQTGEFGADMKVSLVNDGPVTIVIDSRNKE